MAVNYVNLAEIMGQVDTARARDQGMKMNQLLMERQNRQFQREDQAYANQEAIKGAYRGAIGQNGQLDQNMLLSKLYEVDPIKANEVKQQFDTQKRTAQKDALDTQKAELALMADKAKLGRDLIASLTPENYAQGIQQLQAQGFQVAQYAPPQYDPNWISKSVMDANAFIKQAETKQQQEFTAGQNQLNRDVTIRGQNITARNAAESRALTRRGQDIQQANNGAKAPAGYRFTPEGNLEAIKGGPADIKSGELGAKQEKRKQMSLAVTENVISAVDKALSQAGFMETGFIGSKVGQIPGTKAYDLRQTAQTIKANLGFQELQAMRDSSPTGGALGQVAVQELIALQSTVANIDPNQSEEQLKANLEKVRLHMNNWRETLGGEAIPKQTPSKSKTIQDADAILGL